MVRTLREERGSAAALVAVSLVVLVGFSALTLDVGRAYAERLRLQTVAEAAALAGARLLPDDRVAARSTALAYIRANEPVPLRLEAVDIAPDGLSITVSLEGDVPLTLARVLGLGEAPVAVRAVARTGQAGAVRGAQPLGVELSDFVVGDRYVLKLGSGGSEGGPRRGNFHALALGSRGASRYEENLRLGYGGWLAHGEVVDTEPGNMQGPTLTALSERIAADPDATWDHVAATSPRRLLVPLVDTFNVNGRDEIRIVGFAVFFLEAVRHNGEVVGRFLESAVAGRPEEWGSLPDSGTKVVYLTD